MRNNKPSAPYAAMRQSSCPYPLTPGDFPMPIATERQRDYPTRSDSATIPIGMLSPYFGDQLIPREAFPITDPANDGTEIMNFPRQCNPSAPHVNDVSAARQTAADPFGFKSDDVQIHTVPSEPPPAYNKLFACNLAKTPKPVKTATTMNRGTVILPRNRTSGNSPVTRSSTNTRSNGLSKNRSSTNRPIASTSRVTRTASVPRNHRVAKDGLYCWEMWQTILTSGCYLTLPIIVGLLFCYYVVFKWMKWVQP